MLLISVALLLCLAVVPVILWAFRGDTGSGDIAVSVESGDTGTDLHQALLNRRAADRAVPFLNGLGGMLRSVTPLGRVDLIKKRIWMADLRNWTVEKMLGVKVLTTLVGLSLAGVVLLTQDFGLKTVGLSIVLVAAGYMIPDVMLDSRAKQRQAEIQRNLPDMLDQMTISVGAGLSFDAALQRVSASNDSPLSDEVKLVLRDIRFGVPRAKAFRSLIDRTDVQDLRMFVRALSQAERTGAPIATVLRVQADEAREKRRQRAEERAMKLPVKLVLPLVICILPSLFIVIMGPAVLRVLDSGFLGG